MSFNKHVGEVVSIDDPTYTGRIKVRIPGYNDNIAVEQLPWVNYAGGGVSSNGAGGSISIPAVGTQVALIWPEDQDPNNVMWTGVNAPIDKSLVNEIKSDYAGTHVLLYDSTTDLSIKYQHGSGLVLYFQGSYIQLTPDGNITIHQGEGNSGNFIQLTNDTVAINASKHITLTAGNDINLSADSIVLNANTNLQLKGDKPGDCAVNGKDLITLLSSLAAEIDSKIPANAYSCVTSVNGKMEAVLNQKIQYI